jgi:nucleoside-diphosphate kinase
MHSQQTGELLHAITSDGRFQINAIFSIHMTLAMAEELFEVYRGLFLSYTAMLEHMCSTPVLAVMISGTGSGADYDDVVSSFREFVGPSEPALAKVLRPESIRYAIAGKLAPCKVCTCTCSTIVCLTLEDFVYCLTSTVSANVVTCVLL